MAGWKFGRLIEHLTLHLPTAISEHDTSLGDLQQGLKFTPWRSIYNSKYLVATESRAMPICLDVCAWKVGSMQRAENRDFHLLTEVHLECSDTFMTCYLVYMLPANKPQSNTPPAALRIYMLVQWGWSVWVTELTYHAWSQVVRLYHWAQKNNYYTSRASKL
jgi:hypothetical protein